MNRDKMDNSSQRPEILAAGKLKVAILGATGMVGQQFIRQLQAHPWFEITVLAASAASAGQSYAAAVERRWAMDFAVPEHLADKILLDAQDVETVAKQADIAFCAVSLDKAAVKKLEDAYARAGVWVTSNNSAFRADSLTPMVIPSVNPQHLRLVEAQRRARGYNAGGIIVKSNCSIQSYVIALTPLKEFGLERITVHSSQAISGAGKTFAAWPEMENNLIPLISGEEEKSEREPLKIWGQASDNGIVAADDVKIRARCVRVAVADGHTAFVTARFRETPSREDILARWENFGQCLDTPSAPAKLINYREEPDRPQPRLDVMRENGMAVTIGQLEVNEADNEVSFTALAHNAILGAAGGAVWATEVALQQGLIRRRQNAAAV
jgi:aspartate-semialdehyde dehydrogenase